MSGLVRITFDKMKAAARIKAASEHITEVIAGEFLKDANYYARMDTGMLIHSSIISSDLKAGRVAWVTPYARRVFYFGTPAKDKNPNARLQWAEVARVENREKYIRMGEKLLRQKV